MDEIYPKLIGSGIAGILEASIFHPADTISKRLMSNQSKLIITGDKSNFKSVLLQTKQNPILSKQIRGLYNGLGFSSSSIYTKNVWLWRTTNIERKY